MANAYQDLPATLREKMESQAFCSAFWPLSAVTKQYGLTADQMVQACEDAGLSVREFDGEEYVILNKPSVFRDATTKKCSLQVNLSAEIHELDQLVLADFLKYYSGWKWSLHRIIWRFNLMVPALVISNVPRLLLNTGTVFRGIGERFERFVSSVKRGRVPKVMEVMASHASSERTKGLGLSKLSEVLSKEDIKAIAKMVSRHLSAFAWRRGDIMLIDNQQMLHSGMPGYGSRVLKVIMCNPIALDYPINSGVADVRSNVDEYQTVFDQVTRSKIPQRSH